MDRSEDNWNTCLLYRNKQLNKLKYKSRLIPHICLGISLLYSRVQEVFFLFPRKAALQRAYSLTSAPHIILLRSVSKNIWLKRFTTLIL